MQVEIEKLEQLTVEADKIFLTPEGEETLVKLLDIQKQVEQAIDAAKLKLEQAALKLNPNFSSIQADKIKVYYRAYGAKYRIDPTNIDRCPKELYKTSVTYNVDSAAVEKWTEEHKGMPVGINEVERTKSLSFSLKNEK